MNNEIYALLEKHYKPKLVAENRIEADAESTYALIMLVETEDGVAAHTTVIDPQIPEVTRGKDLPFYSIARRALVCAMNKVNETVETEIQKSGMLWQAQQEFGTDHNGLPKIPGLAKKVMDALGAAINEEKDDPPGVIQRLMNNEISERKKGDK